MPARKFVERIKISVGMNEYAILSFKPFWNRVCAAVVHFFFIDVLPEAAVLFTNFSFAEDGIAVGV